MRLIAVGRLRTGPEAELFERYASRLRPRLTVSEVADGRGDAALLAAIPAEGFVVALDMAGVAPDSEALAQSLRGWLDAGLTPMFVIGGADGLPGAVIARAQYVLSLGALTWPHRLARVMLAEQLFRAQSIWERHPYHKKGRPA